MIAYIKGEITAKHPTYVIVETGGIGYHVNISLHTYAGIEKLERVKLLTHLHIKEDSHTLYGFSETVERSLFVHLISVSGVGPNTAQLILSGMNPEELRAAIIAEDVLSLKRVKGVGPKTAQRIILDLKDKLTKDAGEGPINLPAVNNTIRQEALSALVSLGFNKGQVQKVLNSILKEEKKPETVEQLIKEALKKMS
jgi:Holliday junction DNA helicase RuvA